jgi:hypothetical protein
MHRLLALIVFVLAALLALPALAGAEVHGDFNGDGADDAAIGVPYEEVGGAVYAGGVHVIYGKKGKGKRKGGLRAARSQFFTQDSPGIADEVDGGEYFGFQLTAGDFNGDGADDLAISAPYEEVGGVSSAGVVHVLYGKKHKGKKKGGLRATGSQLWDSESPGLASEEGTPENLSYYGLAADDFDGDGADDLVIENTYADVGGQEDAGAVRVLYGKKKKGKKKKGGLRANGNQFLSKATSGVPGDPGTAEYFAYQGLATGDFDRDGRADLAVDLCYETVGGESDAGAVYVLYGKKQPGLSGSGTQMFTQDTPGISDSAESSDYWGYPALAAGNFDAKGGDDLAVGVEYENGYEGAVNLLYGKKKTGLTGSGSDYLQEGSPGVAGSPDPDEYFGHALAAGNFDRKPGDDLAVSAEDESVGGDDSAGALFVVYGKRKRGLGARAGQLLTQDTPGIGNGADPDESWGYTLAPGNFDARAGDDLIVGAPNDTVSGHGEAGAIDVLRGRKKKILSGAGAKRFTQDTPGIADQAEDGDQFATVLMTPHD